jgi:predicted TIM-barrel fold metal-dependent hydrolase
MSTHHSRIDTHHHILPPAYLAAHRHDIVEIAAEFAPQVLGWTVARSLDAMDAAGVATAVTSISAPGIWFNDLEETRGLARQCNEFAAQLAADHKGRFVSFAALPLPDVDASLREIEFAVESLGAPGFGLMTSYGNRWPGDPLFARVFDELNRRRAVVYFHPLSCACCSGMATDVPPAIMEYLFDTARAITSLLYSGTFSRCPDIRFVFSHAGGVFPMIAHRIARYAGVREELRQRLPGGAMPELGKLYLDLVSATNPIAYEAARSLVGEGRLLFGSDYPYWTPRMAADGLAGLGLEPAVLKGIERDNAVALFGGAIGTLA